MTSNDIIINMRKFFSFVVISLLLFACEDDFLTPDQIRNQGYPTIYRIISDQDRTDILHDLELKYNTTFEIDEFGFMGAYYRDCILFEGNLDDQDSVLNFVKKFLGDNSELTGVKDTSQLVLFSTFARDDDNGNTRFIRFYFQNQDYEGIEVFDTKIWAQVYAGGGFELSGNWYPEIQILESDKISFELAQKLLVGQEFSYNDWTGQRYFKLEWDDFNEVDTPEKRIYPLLKGNQIEMRVCWYVPTRSIVFYVDTKTGEIVYLEADILL